jgi:N-acetylmuramoyl-L-alanine amidase
MNRIVNLTNVNRDIVNNREIKYIVIHYVGAVNTAQNNGNYFKNVNRQASAHYFIDENDCVQVVEDKDVAWHSGKYDMNLKSIGIEMCCKNNGQWYFEQATVDNTIELVKELMVKYNIPVENVIRHYDVTGKICPEPYVRDVQAWNNFKNRLVQVEEVEEFEVEQLRTEVAELRTEVAELRNLIRGTNTVNTRKSVDEIAREVIAGKWGNGNERKTRLANAGYNPTEVQNRVNQILK